MERAKIGIQPKGGRSFDHTFKSGSCNFLKNFFSLPQNFIPKEKSTINEKVNQLTLFLEDLDLSAEELGLYYASIANYSYFWNKSKHYRDRLKLIGQDNFFGYLAKETITLRASPNSSPLDLLRVCAASLTCDFPLEFSYDKQKCSLPYFKLKPLIKIVEEDEKRFLKRIKDKEISKIRFVEKAPEYIKKEALLSFCPLLEEPVLADGKYEIPLYLREISISSNYSRYGSLLFRIGELRKSTY